MALAWSSQIAPFLCHSTFSSRQYIFFFFMALRLQIHLWFFTIIPPKSALKPLPCNTEIRKTYRLTEGWLWQPISKTADMFLACFKCEAECFNFISSPTNQINLNYTVFVAGCVLPMQGWKGNNIYMCSNPPVKITTKGGYHMEKVETLVTSMWRRQRRENRKWD